MAGADVSTERLQCCAKLAAHKTTQHRWARTRLASSGVSFYVYPGEYPPLVTSTRINSFLLLKYEHNVMMRKKSSKETNNCVLKAVCR